MSIPLGPDLRVSEFAPDVKHAQVLNEYTSFTRAAEAHRAVHEETFDRILEARADRWRQGRPVTPQDPIPVQTFARSLAVGASASASAPMFPMPAMDICRTGHTPGAVCSRGGIGCDIPHD